MVFRKAGIAAALLASLFTASSAKPQSMELSEDRVRSVAVDQINGKAYLGTNTSPGKIIYFDLPTCREEGKLTLDPSESYISTLLLDPIAGKLYAGTDTEPARVVRSSSVNPIKEDSVAYNRFASENFISTGSIDYRNGFAYFGTWTTGGKILCLDLNNFTPTGTIRLVVQNEFLGSSGFDELNGKIYFGSESGVVTKLDTETFTVDSTLPLSVWQTVLMSSSVDETNNRAYFATMLNPSRLTEVNLQTFQDERVLELPTDNNVRTMVQDGDFAYLGTYTTPGRIIKVNLRDMTRVDSIDLPNEELLNASFSYGNFVYFATDTSPSRLIRVDKNTFRICPCAYPSSTPDLRVRRNGRDVELTWGADVNSDSYGIDREANVTRVGLDRAFTPTRVSTVTATGYTDVNAVGDGNDLIFYSVRGVNCNGEGN